MAHVAPPLQPEKWVERHGDVLYRFALARLREPELAENAVQEAFLAAIAARDRYTGSASERTWLVGILKRKVYDHYRRTAREAPLPGDGDGEPGHDPSPDLFDSKGHWLEGPARWRHDPHDAVERAALARVLEACVEDLPKRVAHAFSLRELDGLDTDEACEILGVTQSNLWVMLHRARSRLRRCLEVRWFANDETPAG